MAAFMERVGTTEVRGAVGDPLAELVRSIVFQKIATTAASAIHGRLVDVLGEVTPETIAAADENDLRAAGLTWAKVAALKDLADRIASGGLDLGSLGERDDNAVIAELCEVKGIGPWTSQMFLIFSMRRPDVWPVGDLGVRTGYARIHRLTAVPTATELQGLGDVFRPYRTTAAWYCWRAVALL